jgi:glycosyltransferase involved in cell wall biosynthesis
VHVHFPSPYLIFPEDLGGIPLVVSVWGSEITLRSTQPIADVQRRSDILRAAAQVVASSKYLSLESQAYAGLSSDRVRTLYWGVDTEKFQPPRRPFDRPVIGFAKHLLPAYGPDTLISAFRRVVDVIPDCILWMAGSGSMESQLRKLAESLGISANVSWAGRIDANDMPSALSQISVCAMPSRRESLGVAAIEAQAMGIPVVATRVGGIPEVVKDGVTGLLVEPEDDEALANALIQLLNNAELRHTFGRQGRENVLEHFDWKASLAGIHSIYQEALCPVSA